MKVLHVSTPSTWRGGEQQVFHLSVMQSVDPDIEPFVLTPENSELSKRLQATKVQVIPFLKKGVLKISLALKIARICKENKIEVVHTHDSHAHTAAVVSTALFGNQTPIIVHRRVDFPVSASPLSSWKYNIDAVKKIICVSDTILLITAPAIRVPERLLVIHSGIDLRRYEQLAQKNTLRSEFNIPKNELIVGNLSALADHKDYPTFLKTVAILLQRGMNMRFVIAGEGPERSKLEAMIAASWLKDKVILTGFRNDVADVLQSLDIFLMTSKTEGLGTILIEAFAAGIPVVATNAGGIPELVINERTGLLCSVGDAENLAAAVQRIAINNQLRTDLIYEARNFAQQFTREKTAEKTKAVYLEVLDNA